MNKTLWNTNEEAGAYFLLGAACITIHVYAMFLCNAIFDFQDEKPKEEKSLFDVIIKVSKFQKLS